jgi:outer membrane protein insertion porin family
MNRITRILLPLIFLCFTQVSAQIRIGDDVGSFDYSSPREYVIGGITVSGVRYLDATLLIRHSGLSVGDRIKIPGQEITTAVEKLWSQGLFSNVVITASDVQGSTIFLNIELAESPRLAAYTFKGVKKTDGDNLKEKIKISRGDVVSENMINRTRNLVNQHFIEKGFYFVRTTITTVPDTLLPNYEVMIINIDKGQKVKINAININGNELIESTKLHRSMKETKEKTFYRIFKVSKFIEKDYKADKKNLIGAYLELGYRDARILRDSVYKVADNLINVDIYISEGKKYYFGDVSWVGNTKYSDEFLNAVLGIKKGDIYDSKRLEKNLFMNLDGADVSSLYLDDGYLFFNVQPVEVLVNGDSINLEIRLNEGKQARIRKVTIKGNDRTNDHVVLRELRTRPGELFNRSDIIRTQRELAALGYFNAETLGVNPKPNAEDGTVDIEYVVEETSQDQFQLSGGWGVGRIVGTFGLQFANFSLRNIFNKESWQPLPSGDGQKLVINAQTNGSYFQAYNLSFTEPWLGGKKPNSFTFSLYHSLQTNGEAKDSDTRQSMAISGASIGLGKRLSWPDDYFTLYQDISFQNYNLNNFYSSFPFDKGNSRNISYTVNLARSSKDQMIYPRKGSELSLSIQATPPYSLFNDLDYSTMEPADKFKWLEYHKWKFNSSFYTKLAGNLVLNTRAKFGFLGTYNYDIGVAPFERFYLGGDGLSGFALDGRELVGLRGYANNTLTPGGSSGAGATIFNKFTLELRYPVSLNPMATVYVLGYVEAGNAWTKFSEYNPFDAKRAAGVGLRIYLPMFGLLGLDYGYGFDQIPGNPNASGSQFHFSINQSLD